MPTVDLSFLPATLWDQGELGELFSELVNAGGDNLESLIVFGSAAAGTFDPATSDINLLVTLRRDDRDVLEAIKPPLSRLMRQFKVSPMVATGEELRTSADVFPVKFLTIKDHHRVLFGADPFAAMTIRKVHLRLRCEQELKNMSLKMRRSLVSRAATAAARQDLIRNFLPAFTTVLRTLLRIAGETPGEDRLAVLNQAAKKFELPVEQIEQLAQVSWSEAGVEGGAEEIEELCHAFLRVVSRAALVADRMAEAVDEAS
jgi:predicted nucleotidyltransferase